jgi:hypothetical protein
MACVNKPEALVASEGKAFHYQHSCEQNYWRTGEEYAKYAGEL